MNKKIIIDIVTTTKIQATIDGKKRTMRLWRLPIPIPNIFAKHLRTYVEDVRNEAICESRTPQEWIDFIKSFPMSTELRGWVTSVIWWHYGKGNSDILYDYYRSFDGLNGWNNGNKQKLLKQLELMRISKTANELALERDKRREVKLSKIIGYYLHGEKK